MKDALIKFALLVLEDSRDNIGSDIDGGWLQERAEELGLLVSVSVTQPCSDDGCSCAEYGDFPQDCLRYADEVRAMIAANNVKENAA